MLGVETIIALASAPIKSALAILRVSGDDSFDIVSKIANKDFGDLTESKMVYATLSFAGKAIDQVMLFLYPKSHSMTGENTVEVTCHGSMVIVGQIVEAFLALGARYAAPGEFSSRAFYHGKMDLVEAEAVNDLINATTRESKDVALYSLSGKTSKLLHPLKEKLGSILGLIEVGIDFPEYDEEEKATNPEIVTRCQEIKDDIKELIRNGEQGKIVRNGLKVAIVGEPNVGKSSLLNALLEKDKALISPIPGTTRDIVEGDISIHGIPVTLLDTAGIHETEDYVEGLGIQKSEQAMKEADLILLLKEEGKEATLLPEDIAKEKTVIEVYNKADIHGKKEDGHVYASALKGEVSDVKEAIFQSLHLNNEAFETPSLSNERELGLLRRMDQELTLAIASCQKDESVDLISAFVQEAYHLLQLLLGEEPSYDLTDEIFSRFCVGK